MENARERNEEVLSLFHFPLRLDDDLVPERWLKGVLFTFMVMGTVCLFAHERSFALMSFT